MEGARFELLPRPFLAVGAQQPPPSLIFFLFLFTFTPSSSCEPLRRSIRKVRAESVFVGHLLLFLLQPLLLRQHSKSWLGFPHVEFSSVHSLIRWLARSFPCTLAFCLLLHLESFCYALGEDEEEQRTAGRTSSSVFPSYSWTVFLRHLATPVFLLRPHLSFSPLFASSQRGCVQVVGRRQRKKSKMFFSPPLFFSLLSLCTRTYLKKGEVVNVGPRVLHTNDTRVKEKKRATESREGYIALGGHHTMMLS